MLIENKKCPVRKYPWGVQLNDELTFLIICCQADLSKDDIAFIHSYLGSQHLDIKALNKSANQHGILPLVYKTLKKLSEENSNLCRIDDTFLLDLKSAYMQISQRNMLMSAELIRIMKVFKENKIEALAFKGPALSQMAYGDITLRQFGDLDILIQKSDMHVIIDLMVADGYVPELSLDTKMKDTFLHALNVIGFYKSATNVLIEVHWELLSKNYAIIWNEKALWAQKRETVSINHTDIPLLPSKEHLLYLCVHGSKHLFERLEWICDIDRSVRADPDINWDYLLIEAEKRGIKRMFCLGLALSEHFFGLALPDMIQTEMQKDKTVSKLISKIIEINFSENTQQGKSYSTFGLLWSMRENFSDRLRFTWYALFAPKFDDYLFINLSRHLAFLYPLIRPFRLATKYFKR